MNRYKFRAECLTDVFLFFNYCPQGSIKNIKHNFIDGLGDKYPDIEISFDSKLSQSEFRQISAIIEDNHVILQTIELDKNYTGERDYDLE